MKSQIQLVASAVVGSLISLAGYSYFSGNPQVVTIKESAEKPIVSQVSVNGTRGASADIDFSVPASKALNGVVHIKNIPDAPVGGNRRGQSLEDLFGPGGGGEDGMQRFFFGPGGGGGMQPQQRGESTGSGVIIANSGYIVTNNHVVENAKEIEVTLHDNRSYKAKVIGTDPSTDLAVVKINADNLYPLTFGNSDDTKIGQWVLAVGNPFNLSSTVTAGVISAKARNIGINRSNYAVESFLQTDAAVNPGNSGGALVNLNGDLVGINTAISSPTGTFAGYSFAVPSKIVEKVVKDLIEFGMVQRGVLGIRIRNIDSKLAKEKDLTLFEGVYVDTVFEKSSAAEGGIKSGDIVTKVGDLAVKNSAELQEAIARHSPGDKVNITYKRNDKEQMTTITLRTAEGKTTIAKKAEATPLGKLGAELVDLTDGEKSRFKLSGGVKVKKISAGIFRNQTAMTEGFVITKVDKKPIANAKELEKIIKATKGVVLIEGIYPADSEAAYYGINLGEE